MADNDEDLYTVPELAQRLKLSVETLYSWRSRGTGPQSFKLSGKVVYRASAVKAWVDEQEAKSTRGGASKAVA